jgi:hypothetical protein
MMERIKRLRPRPAGVTAVVALVLALGMGGAYAADKIGSKDLAKGAVTKKAIKKNAVTKKAIKAAAVTEAELAAGAVSTDKLADNAVTGAKADEASFQGLVRGDGRQQTTTVTAPAVGFLPSPIVLAEVPGMGVVQFIACFPQSPAGADMRLQLLSESGAAPFTGMGTVIGGGAPSGSPPGTKTEQNATVFQGSGGFPLIAESSDGQAGDAGVSGSWDFHLTRGTGADTVGAHVSASGYNSSSTISPDGDCTITATVEYQD